MIHKEQVLRLELYDKAARVAELDGYVEIPLSSLESQEAKDEWHDLLNKDGTPHTGTIRLSLKFIWSKFLYNVWKIGYYENEITKNNDIRKLIEDFYNLLDQNFGILYCGNIDQINKILSDRPHEIQIDMSEVNAPRKSIFTPKSEPQNSIRFTIAANLENMMKTSLGTTFKIKTSNRDK